jgi:hypothetical protein
MRFLPFALPAIGLAVASITRPCAAQSAGQLTCEAAARSAYQLCLTEGWPLCPPQASNCTSHPGSLATCEALYTREYNACQPTFAWSSMNEAGAIVPAARYSAASWADHHGNLWLFGGVGEYGLFGDLWKYTPNATPTAVGQWTQMTGFMPPARSNASFATDASGNLWMFGGNVGGNFFNGLWKYTPGTDGGWMLYGTSEGINVPESASAPGGRTDGVAWVDAQGHFWLFGGDVYVSADSQPPLNDLWEFIPENPGQGTWQFKGGVQEAQNQRGVCNSPSYPGGRYGAASWVDGAGNLWMYGGYGFDQTQCNGPSEVYPTALEDMWEYTASEWRHRSGVLSPTTATASYSAQASPQASNSPGGLMWASAWSDPSGNLWLYGGVNAPTVNQTGIFAPSNLTWEYAVDSNEWIWIAGPSGNPGARFGAAVFAPELADFVLFGGSGTSAPFLQDMWNGQGVVYAW